MEDNNNLLLAIDGLALDWVCGVEWSMRKEWRIELRISSGLCRIFMHKLLQDYLTYYSVQHAHRPHPDSLRDSCSRLRFLPSSVLL